MEQFFGFLPLTECPEREREMDSGRYRQWEMPSSIAEALGAISVPEAPSTSAF